MIKLLHRGYKINERAGREKRAVDRQVHRGLPFIGKYTTTAGVCKKRPGQTGEARWEDPNLTTRTGAMAGCVVVVM
jgi:hypothetical protein